MKRSPADRADLHVSAQVAAALARLDATSRAGALQEQDRVFLDAMRELQAVRDFVGSPENILGRAATKHGEIAERVHVGVSRAWDVLHRRAPIATTDGVPRTGPVDYRVDGVDIQSKEPLAKLPGDWGWAQSSALLVNTIALDRRLDILSG